VLIKLCLWQSPLRWPQVSCIYDGGTTWSRSIAGPGHPSTEESVLHSFTQQYTAIYIYRDSAVFVSSDQIMCMLGYISSRINTVRPSPLKPPTSTALTIHSTEMKVTLNGTVLAESDNTIVVENNHYFPPDSVKSALFTDSKTRWVLKMWYMRLIRLKCLLSSSVCPWKG